MIQVFQKNDQIHSVVEWLKFVNNSNGGSRIPVWMWY